MAKSNREGFRTVETNFEELDEKIQKHRRKIFFRVVEAVAAAAVLLIAVGLWNALRRYDSYEVRSSVERSDTEASHFSSFCGNVLKYSNDGITYMDTNNELIWNQSFEMKNPTLDICQNYVVIYDKGGTGIYIMDESGPKKQIDTSIPIQTVCVARQGTVAVLMKESTTSYVKMFDEKGKELANGEFYGDRGGFPVDIALSADAKKLAVDMIDISDGNIKSTITFYNFGSVGQNEIDNNVGVYSYSDMLIPEIEYLSNDRMVAFGNDEIVIFEGTQKPKVSKEIFFEDEVESIFYNEKYIGMVTNNRNESGSFHIAVYDTKGSKVMENDTEMAYNRIEFLDNNEVCVANEYECELYTVHSIKKFAYTFDKTLYKILSEGNGADYVFILEGVTEEVHLR